MRKMYKIFSLTYIEAIQIVSHYLIFTINIIRIKIKTLLYLSYYKQIKF